MGADVSPKLQKLKGSVSSRLPKFRFPFSVPSQLGVSKVARRERFPVAMNPNVFFVIWPVWDPENGNILRGGFMALDGNGR